MPTALWVSPVSDLAGVARHIIDVARSSIPGWRLAVVAPHGPLTDELRALGIEVHVVDFEQPVPRVVADLRRVIVDVQPELVHSHLAKADVLVALAAPRGTTLISTEHHIQADQRIFHGNVVKAQAKTAMHRARLQRFAQIIAVSSSTKRDLLRHWKPQAPVTVILNGVDRPSRRQEGKPGLRLLSLTRLSPEKNVGTTLRVFERVVKDHPQATLTVGGTGIEEEALRALAAELGIADSVDFAGFIDPLDAMDRHDVLLQPSLADNLSYTLLDAVAHGMGVAASNVGGNAEILPERCLAAPDDVEALARIAIEQGQEPTLRPSLPTDIPTVSQMCAQIAQTYARAGHGNPILSEAMRNVVAQRSPELSVVTAYYKNHATLGAQLDALVAQEDAPPFEVVIADNEGSALLPYLIEPYRDRLDIRMVPASDIAGQCHARNVGVAAARGNTSH